MKQLKSVKNIIKILARKKQNPMAYIWRSSTTFDRLDIGPGKMVSLKMVNGRPRIALAMQLPSSVQVMKVNWAKYNEFIDRTYLVICGKVESEMPV